MPPAISAQTLSKTFRVKVRDPGLRGAFAALFHPRYRDVHAVRQVSFDIAPGEIVAFLGPNGAGKTTTLKMLAGLLYPSAGTVRVAGFDPWTGGPPFKRHIALVLGNRQQLVWDLPAEETFLLNRAIYDIPLPDFRARTAELVELLQLGTVVDKPVRQLSLGERMKCELAAALLHRPPILFLDEPTLGLDVQSRLRIWEYVRMLKTRGLTVVMTTNYLDEADQLCDRLAIIDGGKIKTLGSPAELKIALGGDIVSLTLKETDRTAGLETALKHQPAITSVRTTDKGLDIRVESPEKALPAILESANRLGCTIEFIQYNRPRLDDVFIAHTGRAITESVPEAESA
jgi:ABC-2 type transport system ATP-binding protein